MSITIGNTTLGSTTDGGISYNLMEGFPKFDLDDNGDTTAVEVYLMRGIDVPAFYQESTPPAVILAGIISRPPRRAIPGANWMVTKTCSGVPHTPDLVGDPFGIRFNPSDSEDRKKHSELYAVTINYKTKKPEDRDEDEPVTFLEHSVTVGGEYLTLPAAKTLIQEGDVDVEEDPEGAEPNDDIKMPIVRTQPHIQHHLKWNFVVSPPWDTIFDHLGTVNDRQEDFFFDARKETVMFMGVSGSQEYMWDGEVATIEFWDLDYQFDQRYININGKVFGWNHVYSPKKGKFVRIFTSQGDALHELKNMKELFRAATT